jgi:hypothetical protein
MDRLTVKWADGWMNGQRDGWTEGQWNGQLVGRRVGGMARMRDSD